MSWVQIPLSPDMGYSQAVRHRNLDPTFKGSIPFTPETPWLCVLFHYAHSFYQAITLQCFLAVEPGKNFKKVVTCCRIPMWQRNTTHKRFSQSLNSLVFHTTYIN